VSLAKSFIGSYSTMLGFIAVLAVAGGQAQPMTGRILLATVSDARNRALVGLGPEDFVIDEGGEGREVFAVNMADYPVVILIDNGAEAPGDFDAIRAATARFISRIGQRTVVLGTLADPPAILTSFDDDRAAVLVRIEAMAAGPPSRLMPLEALANAARRIREAEAMFAAVVVVQAPRVNEQTWEEPALITAILESRAIIHLVTKLSSTPPPGQQPAGGDSLLRDLAAQSGGQAATIYSAGSYDIALDRVADRLATEMMIEYLVPPGSQPGGAAMAGVRIPGARVRGLGVSR